MREKTTITAFVFELIDKLKDGIRERAYDIIFRSMFHNKEIKYDDPNLTDDIKNVLITAKYELKNMRSKYNNRVGKKVVKTADTFACKNSSNETERKVNARARNTSNIIYNKNIPTTDNLNTNYYHNQSNQANEELECYYASLEKLLEKIKTLSPETYWRTLRNLRVLAVSDKMKIGGEEKTTLEIMIKIYENLKYLDLSKLEGTLQELYLRVDSKKTTDKTKYDIVSLYNINESQYRRVVHDYQQRTYTPEQLASAYDSLDDELC